MIEDNIDDVMMPASLKGDDKVAEGFLAIIFNYRETHVILYHRRPCFYL